MSPVFSFLREEVKHGFKILTVIARLPIRFVVFLVDYDMAHVPALYGRGYPYVVTCRNSSFTKGEVFA